MASKSKAATKAPKKTAPSHPSYHEMVVEAVASIKDRKGASRSAINFYIAKKYLSSVRVKATVLAKALINAVENKSIKVRSPNRYSLGSSNLKAKKQKATKKKAAEKKPKTKKAAEEKKSAKPKTVPKSKPTPSKTSTPKKASRKVEA